MLKKYAAGGTWFDQMTDRLRTGVANKRTPMASTVAKTVEQIYHLDFPFDSVELRHTVEDLLVNKQAKRINY